MKYVIVLLFTVTKVYSQTDTNAVRDLMEFIAEKNNKLLETKYPKFYLKNSRGIVTNEMLSGKVVFINSWTTFCRPCIAEMNSLNALYENYKDNNKFAFISLTIDDEPMINSAIKEFNISYNIYSITREECYRLNLNNGFPTSIIIDPEGKIHYIKSGGSSDITEASKIVHYEIEPVIKKLLKDQ